MEKSTLTKKGLPRKHNPRNSPTPGMTEEERKRRYGHGGKYKLKDFLEAITGSGGKKTIVQKRLGCSSETLYRWLKERPELQQAIDRELDEYKDKMLDLGMSNVMGLLIAKDPTTSRWVLDRLGAKAGFLPKTALTDNEGEQPYTMTVNINVDDSKIRDASE